MKKIVIIFSLIFFAQICSAQFVDELEVKKNINIAFVPHYLIFNGIRFDFEKKLTDKKSLIIAPQIYFRDRRVEDEYKTDDENYFKTLYGAGVDIYQKHFFKSQSFSYCYFAYGASYNYFYIIHHDKTLVKFIEDNIEKWHYEMIEIEEQIHRMGVNFIFGIDSDINDVLYFDIYAGLGLKYSYPVTNNDVVSDKFDNFMTNYCFSGTVFTSGLKIGMRL